MKWRNKILIAVVVLVALLWAWVITGCSHLTVAPIPVKARVIAFDENTQNAGVIDCDARGCIVTPNWRAKYAEMETEFKHTIAADANIKPEGANYRISYEVYNHFVEMMKAPKRGP